MVEPAFDGATPRQPRGDQYLDQEDAARAGQKLSWQSDPLGQEVPVTFQGATTGAERKGRDPVLGRDGTWGSMSWRTSPSSASMFSASSWRRMKMMIGRDDQRESENDDAYLHRKYISIYLQYGQVFNQ
ncbi:hypothetical protein DMN91_001642 [Ooceraea biroi]|uniref:Uncharacterized protein n=1 Tax=Ooceraea biroi TaxID=2015173 RepID=A0A3L8DYR1_OOCBI|nr:hypothetical protein DMN91_001642 [Ooceraea biroi]